MKKTTSEKLNHYHRCIRRWCTGLLSLCALTLTALVNAQTGTVQIGSGDGETTMFPVSSCYSYSYSQQIVKASELTNAGVAAGPITKIRFFLKTYTGSEDNIPTWNQWNLYLGTTTKSQFSSESDWEPLANLTEVFSGEVDVATNEWVEITLSTPFQYNGESNLIIALDENINRYSCTATWAGYNAPNQGLYIRDDYEDPDATDPESGNIESTVAQVQFEATLASCLPPTSAVTAALTATSFSITWQSPQPATTDYDYYFSSTDVAPDSGSNPSGSVSNATTVTVSSGVNSATRYYVWVRSVCSDEEISSWVSAGSVLIPCAATNIPYAEDFESATPPAFPGCITLQNVGGGNNWTTISPDAAGFTTKTAVYRYHGTRPGNAWFYTQGLNLTAGVSYRLTYKYGNNSTSYIEKLKVALGAQNGAVSMTTTLADHPNITGAQPSVRNVDFEVPTTGVYYIGFNAYSNTNMHYLFVDDISVTESPSCVGPSEVTVSDITSDSALAQWQGAPNAPAGGYDIYYSDSETAPDESSNPTETGVTAASFELEELTPSTTYYLWVRSNCDAEVSEWTAATPFTTLCVATNIPYTEDFESVEDEFPVCMATENAGDGNEWGIAAPGNYGFDSNAATYSYSYANAADAWFYTPGINLTAGVSYRVSYKYGASGYTEKLKVMAGTSATSEGMTLEIADHPEIDTEQPEYGEADFTVPTTGIYYIGFNVYSDANMFYLFVDDINVDVSPSCLTPLSVTAGDITETTATITWQAPITAPSEGYELYYTDTEDAPTATTEPTETTGGVSLDLEGLAPLTKYYVYVRSNCGTDDGASAWTRVLVFTTLCDAPEVTDTTPDTVCGVGEATLSAEASGGVLKWYAGETATEVLYTGETFNTPELSETTTYYVEAVNEGAPVSGAKTAPDTMEDYDTPYFDGLRFDASTNFTLNSVDVYLANEEEGTFDIYLINSEGDLMETVSVDIPAGNPDSPVLHTIDLGWAVPEGTRYYLVGDSFEDIVYEGAQTYPFAIGSVGSVTSGYYDLYGNVSSYFFFYNFDVTSQCASQRVEVTATVTEAPVVTVTVTEETICAGQSTVLTAASEAEGYTYVWTPGDLTGASQTVSPTENTTYTLEATNTTTGCVVRETISVTVNTSPTDLVVSPDAPVVCNDNAAALTVTGGDTVAAAILGTGTTVAGTTSYPNPFSAYYGGAKTQMLFKESELLAQGLVEGSSIISLSFDFAASVARQNFDLRIKIGATTRQNLTEGFVDSDGLTTVYNQNYTPVAGTTGLVAFALTQPYVWEGGDIIVEVAHNAGNSGNGSGTTNYTTATTFDSVYTGRADDIMPAGLESLDALVEDDFNASDTSRNRPNVAFNYMSQGAITWEPAVGLYTDDAATVPYVAGASAATVYAAPDASTVYTVTAVNPNGCEATGTVTVGIANTPDPQATSPQTVSATGGEATIEDIQVTAQGTVTWYATLEDAQTATDPIAAGTAISSGTYYVTQTINGCTSEVVAVVVEVTLGTGNFDVKAFAYHPNPVTNVLTLEYSSEINSVEVYSLVGQRIFTAQPNAANAKVDMSALAEGTYLVTVKAGADSKTIKVVKRGE